MLTTSGGQLALSHDVGAVEFGLEHLGRGTLGAAGTPVHHHTQAPHVCSGHLDRRHMNQLWGI
jgi:hypothetical protein